MVTISFLSVADAGLLGVDFDAYGSKLAADIRYTNSIYTYNYLLHYYSYSAAELSAVSTDSQL